MTLRVYALSHRNVYILVPLSVHVVGQFGLGLYLSAFSDHGAQPLHLGLIQPRLTASFLQLWNSQKSPMRFSTVSVFLPEKAAIANTPSPPACFIRPEPMNVKLAYIFLLLAFDSITFLLTVYYTVTQYRYIARHGITRLSKLFMSIVEGAAMYFGVLAACHAVLVAGVITWRVRTPSTTTAVKSSNQRLKPSLKFLPAW